MKIVSQHNTIRIIDPPVAMGEHAVDAIMYDDVNNDNNENGVDKDDDDNNNDHDCDDSNDDNDDDNDINTCYHDVFNHDNNEDEDDVASNYHLFLIIFLAQGKFQLSCFGSGKSGFHDNPASIIL